MNDWLDQHRAAWEPLLVRCSFPRTGTAVRVGLSGGADSTALTVLAVCAGLDVTCVHVDHGLRDDSQADAALARDIAGRVGALFEAHVVEIEPGSNLEARARDARRGVLRDALLGHTADDRVETLIMFLLRGGGLEMWSTMLDEKHPLVKLRRWQTHRLCADLGLTVADDPMNDDDRFLRVRVRNELIPLMNECVNRDVVDRWTDAASLVAAAAEVVHSEAEGVDPTDARALRQVPRIVALTALGDWFCAATETHYRPGKAALERALEVAIGPRVRADLVNGWEIIRSQQRLAIRRVGSAPTRGTPGQFLDDADILGRFG